MIYPFVRDPIGGEAAQRLENYFGEIGDELGGDKLCNVSRRQSFAIYAMGILGDGERKSVEPMAARASVAPRKPALLT